MLVDYASDSESGSEQQKEPTPPPQHPPQKSGLSALLPKPRAPPKNVGGGDKDNGPKKIIVNLPKLKDDDVADGPPTKKVRIGGGSGLSTLLPAPKRSGAVVKNTPPTLPPTPPPATQEIQGLCQNAAGNDEEDKGLPPGASRDNGVNGPTRFVPQSVARKPIQPSSSFKKPRAVGGITPRPGLAKTKVSLFGSDPSLSTSTRSTAKSTAKSTPTGEYQPIFLKAAKPENRPKETITSAQDDDSYGGASDTDGGTTTALATASITHVQNGPQDLETVAREAGLDDAAMRHLYGRRGRGNTPINITNYSVDEEYNNNEINRSMGLLEEVKPVKSIAPGKHQLSSLLNAAQSQRGALEDAFSQGKRRKKEAGSKYGW